MRFNTARFGDIVLPTEPGRGYHDAYMFIAPIRDGREGKFTILSSDDEVCGMVVYLTESFSGQWRVRPAGKKVP